MSTVKPIDETARRKVISVTAEYIDKAASMFDRKFSSIPVYFDLTGRAAGMYKASRNQCLIRYNPYIFAKYFADNLANTVPHEVAHYVADKVYGGRRIRPHGAEWQAIMAFFACDASRTCDYNLEGIPLRTQRRYTYTCRCGSHQLTTRRHNKIIRNTARYFCRVCKDELVAKN